MCVAFCFLIQKSKMYTTFSKSIFAFLALMIILGNNDFFYSGIDKEFGTNIARCHMAIKSSAVNRDTELCRLGNGILFRMDSANAMLGFGSIIVDDFVHLMADFIAMFKADW